MKKTIYLAGGCFWGTQKYLDQLQGVLTTEVGFANGNTEAPTYEEVCHNNTGHAETVRVEYDAQQMPLARLLKFYFASINPTSLNRQGEDSGSQYRTGVYYVDAADEEVIREACMRSGETVDWLISIGKTYDAADILPPIWGLGDTEADIVPRSLWMASEIDSDEFETGTSINGHYKTLQDHANTIEELAALINVPADNLKEEIDTWNAYCASGKDLRFGRREAGQNAAALEPWE